MSRPAVPTIPRATARDLDRLSRAAHRFHRYAHHPLCDEYAGEVIRVGRKARVCRGCASALGGSLAGLGVALAVARVDLAQAGAALGAGALAVAAALVPGARARLAKGVTRGLPAFGLAFAFVAGARLGGAAGASLSASAVAILAGTVAFHRGRTPDRTPCTTCPERDGAAPCRGVRPIVSRERAFQRRVRSRLGSAFAGGRPAGATLLVAALVGCSGSGSGGTPPEPSAFPTDELGRARILHGVNIASGAKYDPRRLPWIERADALRVRADWGFDFVRYLVLWDGLEPEPGVYDESYLDAIEERLDWFAEAGIAVVLDMHQDGWSLHFGMPLDGAPAWACITDGLPNIHFDTWELNNASPAVVRAVDNFFEHEGDHPELQDRYAAMFAYLAERFRDHPAVIGYEIMNEPFSPHWLFDPYAWDRGLLQPFYERVIAAIRAVDADHWIFYEPTAFLVSDGWPQYLDRIEDPRPGEPRLAFFPHAYSLAAIYTPDDRAKLDLFLERYEANRGADAARYGTPLFIGEFGASDQANQGGDFLLDQLAMFDRLRAGWAYWSHDRPGLVVDADNDETPVAGRLVRTYPQVVAGEPTRWSYDPATRVMELEFVDRAGARGATEIYVPAARVYAEGWEVTTSDPDVSWSSTWDASRDLLSVTTAQGAAPHVIRVAPRRQG